MNKRAAPAPHRGPYRIEDGARRLRGPLAWLLDRAITLAAARAGTPGGIRFTERQLYYETCRVLRPRPAALHRVTGTPAPRIPLPLFTRALDARGRDVAGLLPGTLAARPPAIAAPPREVDLYDYGLPRLLVCQDHSIAGMLLANHVHLEAACPILAADHDLPLDPRVLAALRQGAPATVHVLHDASLPGVGLPARIRAQLGPVPGVRVASFGLVPRQAAALHLASLRGPAPGDASPRDLPEPPELPAGLRPKEIAWLAEGRCAEVAAVRPARLLRAVLRRARGARPPRHSVWTELREARSAGFLTWPGT